MVSVEGTVGGLANPVKILLGRAWIREREVVDLRLLQLPDGLLCLDEPLSSASPSNRP